MEQLKPGSYFRDGVVREESSDEDADEFLVSYDGLDTSEIGSGSVNLPSAAEILADYVAGVADTGAVGEAN